MATGGPDLPLWAYNVFVENRALVADRFRFIEVDAAIERARTTDPEEMEGEFREMATDATVNEVRDAFRMFDDNKDLQRKILGLSAAESQHFFDIPLSILPPASLYFVRPDAKQTLSCLSPGNGAPVIQGRAQILEWAKAEGARLAEALVNDTASVTLVSDDDQASTTRATRARKRRAKREPDTSEERETQQLLMSALEQVAGVVNTKIGTIRRRLSDAQAELREESLKHAETKRSLAAAQGKLASEIQKRDEADRALAALRCANCGMVCNHLPHYKCDLCRMRTCRECLDEAMRNSIRADLGGGFEKPRCYSCGQDVKTRAAQRVLLDAGSERELLPDLTLAMQVERRIAESEGAERERKLREELDETKQQLEAAREGGRKSVGFVDTLRQCLVNRAPCCGLPFDNFRGHSNLDSCAAVQCTSCADTFFCAFCLLMCRTETDSVIHRLHYAHLSGQEKESYDWSMRPFNAAMRNVIMHTHVRNCRRNPRPGFIHPSEVPCMIDAINDTFKARALERILPHLGLDTGHSDLCPKKRKANKATQQQA